MMIVTHAQAEAMCERLGLVRCGDYHGIPLWRTPTLAERITKALA